VLAINTSLYYFLCTRISACDSFRIWPLLGSRLVTDFMLVTDFVLVTSSNGLAACPQPSEGTLCTPVLPPSRSEGALRGDARVGALLRPLPYSCIIPTPRINLYASIINESSPEKVTKQCNKPAPPTQCSPTS